MSILQEMWTIVMSGFGFGSTISIIIMLVVAVGFGLFLHNRGLLSVTTGAMIIFGLLSLAYSVIQGAAEPASLPFVAWDDLKKMEAENLVVMFVAFAIIISIVRLVSGRMAVSGGGDHGGHH